MKTLPIELTKNGFTYTLVLRGERSCIYKQHVTPNISYYEVFVIKTRPAKVIFGKKIPEREVFPADEDFSYSAWSFGSYEKALQRFNELEEGIR